MRDQIKLTFTIGFAPRLAGEAAFLRHVKRAAATVCGGYTCHMAEGGWIAAAGETRADTYDVGALETETAFVLDLTCEAHKADAALSAMQHAIATGAAVFAMPVDWVHVNEARVTARHFSVAAMLATA